MHPILLRLGPLPVPTYGVFALLAFLVTVPLVWTYARRERLAPAALIDGIVFSFLVGLIGARALQLALMWEEVVAEPSRALVLLVTGGTFLGGAIAAIPFCFWWFRRKGIPGLKALDIFAIAGSLSMGVARIGCFFAGCCYGSPTDLPWGVTFPAATCAAQGMPPGPLHPAQLYLSLASFAILGVLLYAHPRKRFDGAIGWLWLVLYGVTRFFIEYLRGDAVRGFVLDGLLSTSQAISLLMIAAGLALLVWGELRVRRAGAGALPPRPSQPRSAKHRQGGPARAA